MNDYPETFPPLSSKGLMTRHPVNNRGWTALVFVIKSAGELRLVYYVIRDDLIKRELQYHPRTGAQTRYEVT